MELLRITESFKQETIMMIGNVNNKFQEWLKNLWKKSYREKMELQENIDKGGEITDQEMEKLEDVRFDHDWSEELLKDFLYIDNETNFEDFMIDTLNKATKLKWDHEKIKPSTTNEDCEEKKILENWKKTFEKHKHKIDRLKKLMKEVDDENMKL